MIAGVWTYRSYRDKPDLVDGDAQVALSLIFGEGIFTLATPFSTEVTGTLDMGGGYLLDLTGTATGKGDDAIVALVGLGRDGTPTVGWEYDYHARSGYAWPHGIDQVPSLLGTVFRARPHGGSPAGVVASFIAVRHA